MSEPNYYQERYGSKSSSANQEPNYYRERYLKEIPPVENVLQRALRGTQTAGSVIGGGFRRAMQAGPASFNTITGGPATELAHGLKSEVLSRSGVPVQNQSDAIACAALLLGGGS